MARVPKLTPPAGHRWTQISSIAAVLSALLGVPAAVVSSMQASEAARNAAEIRVKSQELERLAAANEAQLAEMRRLAAAAEDENLNTARAASSAADAAAELGRIASEARANSASARELAANAKRELDLASGRQAIELRPRVLVNSGMAYVEVGKPPRFRIDYEASNVSVPANAWVKTEFRRVTQPTRLDAPACLESETAQFVVAKPNWTIITANGDPVTPSELADFNAGKLTYAFWGSICYRHGAAIHRTRFCYVVQRGESKLCEGGNGLD